MRHAVMFPLALFAAVPALAQDSGTDAATSEADPPVIGSIDVSGGITATSDYRLRGENRADGALQPTLTVTHESGFYIGAWGSNLSDNPRRGDIELDLYAGWSGSVGGALTGDVGVLRYIYPDRDRALGRTDYWEPYASVRGTLGPASAKLGVAYAPAQDAIGGGDNLYTFADLSAGVPFTPLTLNAHLGRSAGSLTPGRNYWDWSLGADYALPLGFTAGVRYFDTDVPKEAPLADRYDATVLVSLAFNF